MVRLEYNMQRQEVAAPESNVTRDDEPLVLVNAPKHDVNGIKRGLKQRQDGGGNERGDAAQ